MEYVILAGVVGGIALAIYFNFVRIGYARRQEKLLADLDRAHREIKALHKRAKIAERQLAVVEGRYQAERDSLLQASQFGVTRGISPPSKAPATKITNTSSGLTSSRQDISSNNSDHNFFIGGTGLIMASSLAHSSPSDSYSSSSSSCDSGSSSYSSSWCD